MDIAERVAALVAVQVGIRQLADADRIDDDDDDALHGENSCQFMSGS